MKKKSFNILSIFLAVCFITLTFGGCKKMDSFDIGDLPIIEIFTQGNELPKDKENYVNCSFEISNCKNEEDNFSVEMKNSVDEDGSVGIRLRGNSTMQYDKKPYRIKFDKKQSFFGLEKNKNWVLLADYLDTSKIRNYAAFKIAQGFDALSFTPAPNHVVVYINGECKGLYLFCEQIDEKEGRAAVEGGEIDPVMQDEFPFLVEMDRNANKEGVTGVDNFETGYFQPIEIKYPERDERGLVEGSQSDEVFDYIKGYITAVFQTLVTGQKTTFMNAQVDFEDLVDVDSFIQYWLVNEIMFNQDSTWGSVYMYKTADGKLKFGPVWDFDWSMTDNWTNEPYEEPDFDIFTKFCVFEEDTPMKYYVQQPDNFNRVCKTWDDLKEHVIDVVTELGEYKSTISVAAKVDLKYWHGDRVASYFDKQYDYVRLFLLDRYNFFNNNLKENNHSAFLIEK